MADVTANLNLNVPYAGEAPGTWHTLANPNWRALDAVFAGLGSNQPGGTGHIHNGLPGQGPQISHDDLTDAGTKTHAQIEIDLADIVARLTFVETTYCADITCGGSGGGGGGGGAGDDPHPPVHYTENFTTELGTRLAQMDWFVQSDSGVSDVQASGHSGYLAPWSMGYPATERYAAVVRCQIPHMECQRVTYHVTRLTADGLADGDSIMMVMALYSTHLLGAATPYIQTCGIKMILILSKQGGTYSVTRQAIAEVSDNDTHLLKQDHAEGLTFNEAEQFFRGCHEFSVDNNGGVWYYHKRAPIWILPAGTASPYFPQLTATLLSLQEPPFGSIGFGWAWNVVESATWDVEMAWLTIDSKANVLEEYTTNYPDPGNEPVPFDPPPTDLCCGGIGPQIGAPVDLGDGLKSKAIACVDDPWQGVLLENGMVMPCSVMGFPPSGDTGPTDVDEGSEFIREIPIDNMTPEVNTDWTVNDPDGVLSDYRVEVNLRGVTVSGQTAENSSGGTTPTISVYQATDLANSLVNIPIVSPKQIGPTITGIEIFDRDGVLRTDIGEGLRQRLIISLDNYTDDPPFPKTLGGELAVTGTVSVVERKRLIASNQMQVDIITPNQDPPYGNTLDVVVQDPTGLFSDTANREVKELAPYLRGAFVTNGPPAAAPPPPFAIETTDVVDVTIRGDHFDTGADVWVDAPDSVVPASVAVVDDTTITCQILIGSPLGFPIKAKVINPSGMESNSGVTQPILIVGDLNPFLGTIIETSIDGTPTEPVEGQDVLVRLYNTPLAENVLRFVEADISGTPIPYEDMWGFEWTQDYVEFKVRLPAGLTGVGLHVLQTKNQLDVTQQAEGTTSPILVEPTPAGVVSIGDLSPGATGVLSIAGPGNVFYGQDLEAYIQAGEKMVVTNPVIVPFDGLKLDYEILEDAGPGADTFNLVVKNRLGTTGLIPIGTCTFPSITITALEYVARPLIEGRNNIIARITGTGFRAGITAGIVAGTVTVHDLVFISDTEVQIQLDAPQNTGGDPFTLQLDNPAPDLSSATIGGTVLAEPIPKVNMVVKPPTTGAARIIELVGQNLFVPDSNVPGPITPAFSNFNLDHWDIQSNGFWRGVGDVTGGANDAITLGVDTPGGNSFPSITDFTISAVSVTPVPASFAPTGVEGYVTVNFTILGTDFDSVTVVRAVTSELVPIGSSQTIPMVISSMTSEWIVGTLYLPGGYVGLPFDIQLLDSTLTVLATLSTAFVGEKGAGQPYITNKFDPYPDETTPFAAITHNLQLDPATPVPDLANWSITNGTLISVVDLGAGLVTVQWTNGAAGEIELRVTAPSTVPPMFDVLRRTLV